MEHLKQIFINYNWEQFLYAILILFFFTVALTIISHSHPKLGYRIKRKIGGINILLVILALIFIIFNYYLLVTWFALIDDISTFYNTIIFIFLIVTITVIFSIIEYVIQLNSVVFFKVNQPYSSYLNLDHENKIFKNGQPYEEELNILNEIVNKLQKLEFSYIGHLEQNKELENSDIEINLDLLTTNKLEYVNSHVFECDIPNFLIIVKDTVIGYPEDIDEICMYYLHVDDNSIHIGSTIIKDDLKQLDEETVEGLIIQRIKELRTFYIPFELRMIDKVNIPLYFFVLQNISEIFATKRKILEPNSVLGEVFHLTLGVMRFISLGLLIKILF